jgi:hypothetical protein
MKSITPLVGALTCSLFIHTGAAGPLPPNTAGKQKTANNGIAAEAVDTSFNQRRDTTLANIQKMTPPDLLKNVDRGMEIALLLLFKNEKVEEANRMPISAMASGL